MQESNERTPQDELIENDNEGISFSEIFHTLWIKKRLLISVTIVVALISAMIILQLVPRYTATTQLLIGINAPKVVDIEQVITGGLAGSAALAGEIEVMKSRELARRVIEKLNLDKIREFNPLLKKSSFFSQYSLKNLLPESWREILGLVKIDSLSEEDKQQVLQTTLINVFLEKLIVKPLGASKIINLTYEAGNAKLAAKIANEVAEQYIIGQMQSKFDATKKATDWLNDQLGELKQTVEYSEQAVEIFRQEHGLIQVSEDTGLSQEQLSQINSQLIIARSERSMVQAKYNQITELLKSGNDIETIPAVLNSSLIQDLRQQEATEKRAYSEMLMEFGKKHPRMIRMRAKVQDIRDQINAEVKKIAAGLGNELAITRSRENSLAYSLKKAKTTTGGNRQAEVQLRALEREASANRMLFETFLLRFKETTSTQGIEQADARVISFAEPPLSPSFPKKNKLLAISAFGALAFAMALIFGLELLNPGIRSPEQIQSLLKIPTLGIVPMVFENEVPHQYLLKKPHSSLAEAINTLRVSLSVLNPDSQVKSLLITSSVPGEGKSTLALLIARQSALSGQRVVIVDTDFRRPAIAKALNFEDKLGLTDLVAKQYLKLDDILIEDTHSDMMILTRGKGTFINPTDIFASQRLKGILDELKKKFDLIILDSPPVMAVPDARVLSALVDKVIFVLAWDETPRKVALSALHQLQREGLNNLAGVVLQKVNLKQYGRYGDSGYYYHYSRYGQYYAE